jgi:hypothetical protein
VKNPELSNYFSPEESYDANWCIFFMWFDLPFWNFNKSFWNLSFCPTNDLLNYLAIQHCLRQIIALSSLNKSNSYFTDVTLGRRVKLFYLI